MNSQVWATLVKNGEQNISLPTGGSTDLALVAEATNFRPGWVEAGKVFFKVTIFAGPSKYTPFIQHGPIDKSNNAIVRTAVFIPWLKNWAKKYQEEHTTHFAGGTVIPKVNIGAIRGGLPYQITRSPEICSLYVDVRPKISEYGLPKSSEGRIFV